jgi:hypothetical protein
LLQKNEGAGGKPGIFEASVGVLGAGATDLPLWQAFCP